MRQVQKRFGYLPLLQEYLPLEVAEALRAAPPFALLVSHEQAELFLMRKEMYWFRKQMNPLRRLFQRRSAQVAYVVLSLRSPVSVLQTGARVITRENARLKMVKVNP